MLTPHGWPLALGMVLLAGVIDVALGEPPNVMHPVVWMGRLIGALEARRPRRRHSAELAYGVVVVLVVAGLCAAAGLGLVLLLARLPWWLALPVGALVLKTAFSLRGLVDAGRQVQRDLGRDLGAARDDLASLVSRGRELPPPQVVSAAVESLAENLSDSVVAPLLFFALFGLPGALAYRAVNTMDAMLGYRGEYEYAGKAAARTDDALNWVPARLTALLLVALGSLRGTAPAAWTALRTRPRPAPGPNKLWTISAMAGLLGVQLEKPGSYAVGLARRPLEAGVIGEAAAVVWAAGGIAVAAAAALAALLAWGAWA
jgi:adenosylcobinamide-phosphate synthase